MRHLWLEYELEILGELITTIDQKLVEICQKSTCVDDGDGFGYFDSAEHVTGLGFVACQTYMATVYGYLKIDKQKALAAGPRHSCGRTKVQIINHAANYWKHNNEWALDRSTEKRQAIEKAFESVGFPVGTEYPLSGVLTEVASPEAATFRPLLQILES
jgi:hypothetical protein